MIDLCYSLGVPVFIENGLFSIFMRELYHRDNERKWSSDTSVCSNITSDQISRLSVIKGSDTLIERVTLFVKTFSWTIFPGFLCLPIIRIYINHFKSYPSR